MGSASSFVSARALSRLRALFSRPLSDSTGPLSCLLVVVLASAAWAAPPFVDPPSELDGTKAPAPLALEIVASGLNLPVYATSPAGDTARVFVLELYSGLIRLVKNGAVQPTPFLDLSATILGDGERGLLGLAFHPDFASNRFFYVFYNTLDGASNLFRYRASAGNPDVAQPNGQLLLKMSQPFKEHNGGMLQFGPDGMLYVSTGDGGGALDPLNQAQDLTSLLGKILRLDVDGGLPYAIPADNPFVTTPGALGEIFAYGLRNPWRFSIDQPTGSLFIGDVGADTVEEINYLPGGTSGQNFGWRCKEGVFCTGQSGCVCPASTFTDALFEYFHSPACAVIGGFVYRGQDLVGHQGRYFFTDYCDASVISMSWQGGLVSDLRDHSAELIPPDGSQLWLVPSFGLDGRGELLIVSQIGNVYRVIPFADCDGDGISDSAEIAAGSAFDVNGDGLPDECQPLLQGSPMVSGQTGYLYFIGAEPGQPVLFFLSLAGLGVGPCFFSGTLCLDLAPFSLLGNPRDVPLFGITTADAEGASLLPVGVPASLMGLTSVAFQGIAADGVYSTKSNALVLPLLP